MKIKSLTVVSTIVLLATVISSFKYGVVKNWQSKWVKVDAGKSISYLPDEKGNIIPDFSYVGYYSGDKEIPTIAVVKKILPAANGSSQQVIQDAIDEVSKRKLDANGFRGTILLSKGVYNVPGTLHIKASGIVIRGEGDGKEDTRIIATGKGKRTLLEIAGAGKVSEVKGTRVSIKDSYVPVGTFSFTVASAKGLKPGDSIIVYRPGTDEWIKDLKMDQIVERPGTQQWKASGYNFEFERIIKKIKGNKIYIDNPIVMAMESKYGGGQVYKYTYAGRIEKVGVEDIYFGSEYASDTAEDHGWDAVTFDKIRNGWVKNITAQYFGYSCVNLHEDARNISVLDSKCIDAKSIITGGRRYSFNNNGQMNLFVGCHTSEGRHDFVTGGRVKGPNVFVNCIARNTHADIGPHHRWAMGTLYDNIDTDGEINVRDRGNSGSGHGWAGVNQVLWNCKAKSAIVESPWVSGQNYVFGLQGEKKKNKLGDRPDGIWEGNNQEGLQPKSLYYAQLKARKEDKK